MSVVQRIVEDVGYFTQGIAAMELALDDLLGLANARFKPESFGARKYPVQLSNKIAILPNIAALVEIELPREGQKEFVDDILDVRQDLQHGKIVQVRGDRNGYEFDVAKMSLPDNINGRQRLLRDIKHYTDNDLLVTSKKLMQFNEVIEQIRGKVFVAGEGWPTYMPETPGDPLGLKNLDQRMSAYGR